MGRTISTGMTEDFLDENINMKREFTVSPDGRQVDVKIASNMSEEETKKFLKAMLEKAGEEVAGQSEEIFNTLKALGMADINSIGAAHIYVGDKVMFGPNVSVITASHPIEPELRARGLQYNRDVHIGDNVWIGTGVIILPGVHIGKNSVIGAGSVVTKDVPDNVVAFGNPCRVIRRIEPQDVRNI